MPVNSVCIECPSSDLVYIIRNETIDIVQGSSKGPVSLRFGLKNVTIVGYSDMKVSKVQ